MNATDMQDLQSLCELGQEQLVATQYFAAEKTLLRAERLAIEADDFDTLSRLYMPLQEARRQRRQVCGEGKVVLDLIATEVEKSTEAEAIIDHYPHGQLLVAGWGTIEPATRLRRLAFERGLYVETFLAASYPAGDGIAVVIVPNGDVLLPEPNPMPLDMLLAQLPPHSIVMNRDELPKGERKGTTHTFAETMAIWERLHLPFLAAADMEVNPLRKIDGYRKTLDVDYACELAHQKLSSTAHALYRGRHATE